MVVGKNKKKKKNVSFNVVTVRRYYRIIITAPTVRCKIEMNGSKNTNAILTIGPCTREHTSVDVVIGVGGGKG